MISLRHIHKTFNQHLVLKDINLDIRDGEILGIIGGSGAGKSTLLRCINLLERPDQGEICIDEQNILQLDGSQLSKMRQKIGMIFQHYHLLNQLTVLENIALPMKIQKQAPEFIQNRCIELLKIVDLEHKKNAYPAELSGGQKQRVAIARALSTQASILLCDEATAALDPSNTQAILTLLQDIQQEFQMTIVLITHDMQVAKKICHRIALMEHGQIIETCEWPSALKNSSSLIRNSVYGDLSSQLPPFIIEQLSSEYNTHSILRLIFPGHGATIPFISEMCRNLEIDINILSAQIDHTHHYQCGVMIVSLGAEPAQIQTLLHFCQQHHIIGEILGYVERIHH
jgi:D-methionine transport system ATP-binding protein